MLRRHPELLNPIKMIKQFTFNHYQTNCYLVIDEATKACAIIDPCAQAGYEDEQLEQYIRQQGLEVRYLLLTHAHVDHIAGLRHACNVFGLPVRMHPDGMHLLKQAGAYGAVMGFDVDDMSDLGIAPINDGDILSLGETKIECRFTPGHCPGSMSFVLHGERMAITGDALFCGSIGRTDLPGGSLPQLLGAIREKLLVLDDDYSVLPGHGDCSSIGDERNNPFMFEY